MNAGRSDRQQIAALTAEVTELRVQVERLTGTADTLRVQEEQYRSLFESSPISLWEEDYSGVKAFVDALQAEGVIDLEAHFRRHPDQVQACSARVIVDDVNQATLDLLGLTDKASLLGPLRMPWTEQLCDLFRDEVCAFAAGERVYEADVTAENAAGEPFAYKTQLVMAAGFEDTWGKVWVTIVDTTGQVHAQQVAMAAEQQSARLATAHQMIAMLQHEINNPLQGVLGFAEYLNSKLDEHHEYAEVVRKIYRGATRIEELVHRLEHLSELETKPYLGGDVIVDVTRSTSGAGIVSQ